ncbi:hypothetical protein G6F55_010465 [Rhizopus delemar]|uniref:Uncharacterized protein n=3 Tax=Rhizopus TaxID=4842 RepID=I1CDW1_RHIO9|nr:hypothetical protein RO3G_11352 [Rhizopus delemar RA 99-880]KAG1448793.1 hypothetical protein G6F55_010465 [Rhizopus delemar]KAG1536201.1 hypothetical protein G6F51_011095 [Rhizopus arrhizus]KAG1499906.1 hypothetical protein G6F52_012610 [Rhizopus delemar]KAG1502448.1 hypothetical protein G6F53_010848 [Rhizopus delemar]|eukprot:EIE86641.1 hypothetical protein RO3G_11352 [Rhizopus delemar RA 99-880]
MNPWQIFAQEAQTGSCTVSTCPTSNASVTSEYPTATDPPSSWHNEERDLLGFEDIGNPNTSDTSMPWRHVMKNKQEESEARVTMGLYPLPSNKMDPKESIYSASRDPSGLPQTPYAQAPSDPHRPFIPHATVQPNRSREESEDSHQTATDQPSWLLDVIDETLASVQLVDDEDPIVRYTKDEMHEAQKRVNAACHKEGIQAGQLIHMFIALEKSAADEQYRQRERRYHNTYYTRSRSYTGHDHATRDYRKEGERKGEGCEGEWVQSDVICIGWADYHDNPSDVERKVIFVPIRAPKHVPEDAQNHGFQSGVPIMSAASPLLCLSCKWYAVI